MTKFFFHMVLSLLLIEYSRLTICSELSGQEYISNNDNKVVPL